MSIKDAHKELVDYISRQFGIKMKPILDIAEDTFLEEDQESYCFGDYFRFTYGAISLVCLLEAPGHMTYALYCVDDAGNLFSQCFLLYNNFMGKGCAIDPEAIYSEQELMAAKERVSIRLSEYHENLGELSPFTPI